jgi:hypothetical protein
MRYLRNNTVKATGVLLRIDTILGVQGTALRSRRVGRKGDDLVIERLLEEQLCGN